MVLLDLADESWFPLVMILVTGLASYIPARRALTVEPVAALRVE